MPRDLDAAIDARRDDMVDLLAELIAARTENPPDLEQPAAQIVERRFRDAGIRYDTYEKELGRTNVIGHIGSGAPALLVACHLDVVPAGEGWDSDPFCARIEGDRLYGRGAADNKGQMAACLVMAECLKPYESGLHGELQLAGVADEERGSALGLAYLVNECGLAADCAIIPDVLHNMNMIDVAEKGVLFLKITSFGKQAHGSRPETGINAVWNMVDLLNRLRERPLPVVEHRLLSPATLNLGTIAGGQAPNIVPGKCEVMLDIRFPMGQSRDDVLALIQGAIDDTQRAVPSARFTLEVETEHAPSEVAHDVPIVPIIQRHAEAVTGRGPKIEGMSGATVTKQLIEKGIPAVGFAPGDIDEPHTANESVSIQELVDFAKVMARICLDYLG